MKRYIEELVKRYPVLSANSEAIYNAYVIMRDCYILEGKLLIAGNGGSAADAEHIVAELMKGFALTRKIDEEFKERLKVIDPDIAFELAEGLQKSLPAIALSGNNSLSTAVLNDINGKFGFAQQVNGYGKEKDVLLAISTSGNSENILHAAVVARAKGMKVIGLTGASGGRVKKLSDVMISVPEQEVYKVQELHLPIYHCLCMMLEQYFYGEE